MTQGLLILIFIVTSFLFYMIFTLVNSKRQSVLERIRINTHEYENANQEVPEVQEIFEDKIETFIQKLGKIIFGKKHLNKKRKKIAQAAILMKPEEFMMMKIFVGIIIFLLFLLIGGILFAILGFLLGFVVPDLFLNIMKNRRLAKLNSQLPESLSIIANGLRAGYSFTQSLDIASRELDEPISGEFKKALRDNSFGKPIEKGMAEIVDRTGNEDISLFVTAFTIQRQVGGNLAEILDQITETLRDRIKIRGEIKVMTAQGKFSAFIISLLPVAIAMAIFMLNPEYIKVLFTNSLGIFLLVGAVLLEIVGMIIIRGIINIKI